MIRGQNCWSMQPHEKVCKCQVCENLPPEQRQKFISTSRVSRYAPGCLSQQKLTLDREAERARAAKRARRVA